MSLPDNFIQRYEANLPPIRCRSRPFPANSGESPLIPIESSSIPTNSTPNQAKSPPISVESSPF
ncbi:hypothetical protein HPP92_019018 [Vanilla planifolia]|uniref:Uncharacterized protein n=1 Tax=Vanilla planifolia TaxID=51239 RepID=A0A835Q3A3_VANPL|nr:hypothetical protein HPP92_019018 [Vanilla planifolia]